MPSSQKRPYGLLSRATTFPGARKYVKPVRVSRNGRGRAGFGNLQRNAGMASVMTTSRIGQRNYETLRIRIPIEFRYDEMLTSPDGSMFFNILFAPWDDSDKVTDLSASPQVFGTNRLYSGDIANMRALWTKYRLGSVSFDLDRPKIYSTSTNNQTPHNSIGANTFQPSVHCGTQVIHSEVNIKPDNGTEGTTSTTTIAYKLNASVPTTWREGVDNQSSRFNLHKDKKSFRANWRPTTEYERKWKDNTNSDEELCTGGLHIRFKDKYPIPDLENLVYRNEQIILSGYATYVMQFKDRT